METGHYGDFLTLGKATNYRLNYCNLWTVSQLNWCQSLINEEETKTWNKNKKGILNFNGVSKLSLVMK